MQRYQALPELVPGNLRFNLIRKVAQAASARGNRQFMKCLAEHGKGSRLMDY
jgi:hypothetical protein